MERETLKIHYENLSLVSGEEPTLTEDVNKNDVVYFRRHSTVFRQLNRDS